MWHFEHPQGDGRFDLLPFDGEDEEGEEQEENLSKFPGTEVTEWEVQLLRAEEEEEKNKEYGVEEVSREGAGKEQKNLADRISGENVVDLVAGQLQGVHLLDG